MAFLEVLLDVLHVRNKKWSRLRNKLIAQGVPPADANKAVKIWPVLEEIERKLRDQPQAGLPTYPSDETLGLRKRGGRLWLTWAALDGLDAFKAERLLTSELAAKVRNLKIDYHHFESGKAFFAVIL